MQRHEIEVAIDQLRQAEERRQRAFKVGAVPAAASAGGILPRLIVGDRVVDLKTGRDGEIVGAPTEEMKPGMPYQVRLVDGQLVTRSRGELERAKPPALPR